MLKIIQEIYVEWGHCDPARIVFNPNFYKWIDAAQDKLFITAYPDLHSLHKKIGFAGIPLVANESKFLKPARYADLLQLHSQLTHVGNSSFHMHHQFFKGEDLLVVCKEVRVWTCRTAEEPEKPRASPIPADVRDGLLRSECHTFRLVKEHGCSS